MRTLYTMFIDFIRKPEWVAAVALLIQAVILWLQARILRKHGRTMEEQAGIAKNQATTAELIGNALEKHAEILDEQTKITEQQFKFQRRSELHAARGMVYDQLLILRSSVMLLISKIESPGERYAPRIAEEEMAQSQLTAAILPVQKAAITSLYLTKEEKEYFSRYTLDLLKITTAKLQGDVRPLKEFTERYKDILAMILKVGETPEERPSQAPSQP